MEPKKPGEIIWSRFRCGDLNCNTLLTKEQHDKGFCGGCQGVRFLVARYITDEEAALIEKGELKPHEINLDEIGVEPLTSVR